jgi:hypothetical protein
MLEFMVQAERRQKAERRKVSTRLTPNPSPRERGVRALFISTFPFIIKQQKSPSPLERDLG